MNRRLTDTMTNEFVDSKRAGRRHIVLGFSTVLLVMVVVSAYTLLRISAMNDELSSVVNVHNVKSDLISELRDSMRQRQLSLRDMLLAAGPFEREEAWEQHTLAASRFMAARIDLLDMPMSADEKTAFDKMTKGATDGANIQREVISKIEKGGQRDKLIAMSGEALAAQDSAFDAMNEFSLYQQNAAQELVQNAQKAFQQTIRATVIFVFGGVLVGVLVAWSVLARDKHMKTALDAYQNRLESLVQARTTELLSANSELESYSYSLAHDLNAPLRAVTSYSQILEEDARDKLNESEIDSLQRITRAGRVMNRLIEDILKLSRITRSGFHNEVVSLSELAKSQATRLSSVNIGREIQWDIAEDILVKGDSFLLNLLFEHLFENAVKFTRNVVDAKIQFGVISKSDSLVYFVKDNGCGFDMRYSDRLFMAFQRLHSDEFADGTGVGLAMVQRIIQRHEGKVWAESGLGVGSTFFFTIGG